MLYARVSTLDQGERYSLPSQLAALKAKAARDGCLTRADLVFVDKHTGKEISRPEFDRMNALIKSGAHRGHRAYIFSVDRFARRTEDALRLAREYAKYGVKLDFVESPYENTPIGRFQFTQLAAFAEFMGEKILADSARGRKQKLEMGKLTNGSAPFGYLYIDKRQPDGARFVINPDARVQETIRKIFEWCAQGVRPHSIARRLADLGLRSPGSSSKKHSQPGTFGERVLRQIIRRRTYVGEHVISGITVPCPALIERPVWEKAQRMLDASRAAHVGRPSRQYLLRSLLWCAKCGRRIVAATSIREYPCYRCGNVTHRPYQRICRAPQIQCRVIEEAAFRAIWELLTDSDALYRRAKAYYDSLATSTDATAALEAKLKRVRSTEARLVRMMRDEVIDYAAGLKEVREARAAARELEEQLVAAGRIVNIPTRGMIEADMAEAAGAPMPTEYAERRAILEGLRELKMHYYKGDLTIEGKVPVGDALLATTSNGKNSERSFTCAPNSFLAIPFKLKVRVAA